MRGTSGLGDRLPLPLSIAAIVVALAAVTPQGQAASDTVRTALFASDAGSVSGVSAARRPRPRVLLALDRDGRYPRSVIPPTVGVDGPRGAQGVRGAEGPAGEPGGYMFFTRTRGQQVSRFLDQRTTVSRLEDLPPGSWLVFGLLSGGGVASSAPLSCSIVRRNVILGTARASVGRSEGGQRRTGLALMTAWTSDAPSSLDLDCGMEFDPGGEVLAENIFFSAIRVGSLEVRRQGP